jgi:hypothetical protein
MRVARLLIALCALASPLARGDPLQHEFLLFTRAEGAGTFDRTAPVTRVVDEVVKADMLFSLQHGPLKLFGEYLVSDHEGDLERLQLGWQLSDDTIVWVGRFHQPTSVWNHDHHHGQYLQTSITRPAIDEWEDLGGVLPQHFTGMLLESSQSVMDTWRLRTAVGAGLAPQLTPDGMVAFNLLHPDSNRRQMGYQARASLHPGEFTESGIGALVANDRLSAVGWNFPPGTGFDAVDLQLYGLFGAYVAATWRVTATVYYADAQLIRHQSSGAGEFIVGYVQAEQRLVHDLTGFLRWEDSSGADRSQYLKLFEAFARSRHVGGLRWDFARSQALTLQLSDTHTLNGHFADIRFQWSAAFF